MSTASKLTVAAAVVVSTGIISYVHYQQNDERRRLHEGVIRDVQRQNNNKNQNISAVQSYMETSEYGEVANQIAEEEAEKQFEESMDSDKDSKPPLSPHERKNIKTK